MLAILILLIAQPQAQEKSIKIYPKGRIDYPGSVRFTSIGKRIITKADKDRYRWAWEIPEIDLANESFRVVVPKEYSKEKKWGLFVWTASDSFGEPHATQEPGQESWQTFFARHKMLLVGANNAPNARNPLDRLQLAMTAVANMKEKYSIDEKQIVVSGMSGGGKIACLAGRYAPDVFCGVIAVCGPAFHHQVSAGGNLAYGADMFVPEAEERLIKRKVVFTFITGDKDFNHQPSISYELGYKKYGYRSLLIDIPGLAHSVPHDLSWFDKALTFIFEEQKSLQTNKGGKSKSGKSSSTPPKLSKSGSGNGK